jgi:hypothetical protein
MLHNLVIETALSDNVGIYNYFYSAYHGLLFRTTHSPCEKTPKYMHAYCEFLSYWPNLNEAKG